MNARIDSCCKNCTDRHLGCHDHCEAYQDALTKWKAFKDMVYQAKNPTEHDKYKFASIEAMRKRRKWHDR